MGILIAIMGVRNLLNP